MIWINCCQPPRHPAGRLGGEELDHASYAPDACPKISPLARNQLPKLTAETVRCIGNWRRGRVRPVSCELFWVSAYGQVG